jgi:ATP-binding cassette, subfamily D (ALD), member 4
VIAILPGLIGYYTYKSFVFTGWEGPVIIFSFFCLGTFINRLILKPIVRLIFHQERLEGDFRFLHVRFRESTESVAMHRGESVELKCINQSFASLLKNQIRITHWESLMNCKRSRS